MTLLENETVQTERRATPREHIPSLIYLSLEENNGGIVLDLSPNGMRVSAACPLHTGTNVHFSFEIGSSQRIEGIGHVSWIAGSGKSAGICFQDLSVETSEKIGELLKSESLNAVADYFPPKHEPEPSSKAQVGLPRPAVTTQLEKQSPAPESFAPVSSSPSDDNAGSTCLNGPDLMAETTVQFILSHGNSPVESPATTDYDTPTDFSSYLFEFHNSSPGQDTFSSDSATVYNQEDNQPRLPSDTNLDAKPPEFVGLQSDLPLKEVTEQSHPPAVNSPTFQRWSGLNAPLQPFTLTPTYECPPSPWALVGKSIVSAFVAIGGELETDWHAITGLLLLAAGFLALLQHPPLVALAVALWIAAALMLTGKKGATQKTDP